MIPDVHTSFVNYCRSPEKLRQKQSIIFESDWLTFAQSEKSTTLDIQIVAKNTTVVYDPASQRAVAPTSSRIWTPLRENRTDVFLHVLLIKHAGEKRPLPREVTQAMISKGEALYAVVSLVKYDKIPKTFRQRYLLSDLGLVAVTALEGE